MSNKTFKTGAAQTSSAIKAELKKEFPGIKFSVTSSTFSMGDSVHISWADGPNYSKVEALCDKYQYGHFNGMEDIYEHSNRRDDLPQAKYVQYRREQSADIKALEPILAEYLEGYNTDQYRNKPEQILYRIFSKQSIPAGAKITGIEKTDISCGSIEDFYRITFEVIEQAPTPAPVNIPADEVQIIDYSAKAVAVIGNTKPIKEKLKQLGGSFNFRLTCGAGWIFPKSKLQALQSALSN